MNQFYSLQVVSDSPSPIADGFLLIEPTTADHEPFLQTLPAHSCTPRILSHRDELMPRLVDIASLDSEDQAQLSDLLVRETRADRPPVACAWLASEASIEELAVHIARYLVGPGADGRPAFWRFYDPRVLALTLTVFDPVQRAALLGPITEWQFAWAGHRWAIARPGTPNDESAEEPPAWPRPDQWPRINRSQAAARVVDRLPPMAAERAARLPAELDRIFREAVDLGGMSDTDELADYAWHCMRYGQAFEQHPIVVDAWPALSRRELHWSDVLVRFTANDLEALERKSRALQTERT